MPKSKKTRDHVAKLVIHGLPNMTGRQFERLIDWLASIKNSVKREEWGKVATWRLMK